MLNMSHILLDMTYNLWKLFHASLNFRLHYLISKYTVFVISIFLIKKNLKISIQALIDANLIKNSMFLKFLRQEEVPKCGTLYSSLCYKMLCLNKVPGFLQLSLWYFADAFSCPRHLYAFFIYLIEFLCILFMINVCITI